jgi:serine/threonine protein kinase
MSAVYKASDPNLKRVVAIKLIHPHLSADASFVMRFEEEASAVAKLRHANIVQVYDFNIDNGVYYMVLEYIPGESLHDRLGRLHQAGEFLSVDQAVKFAADICDAMNYAHERGIIHRDIKPPNIMLDVHGHAILMDFGIVKILGGDSHTATGAVVGTARYMAPEVIRGEVADGRSDIYSMGATLYEMLGGRPPFMADSAITLMMMHLNDQVPDVRKFRPDLPISLIAVLEKALQKDRNLRYNTAAEMAADLRSALTAPAPLPPPVPTVLTPDVEHPAPANATMARRAGEVALASQAAQQSQPAEPGAWKTSTAPSMQVSAPAIPKAPAAAAVEPAGAPRGLRWWIAGAGIVGLLVCCVAVGAYALPRLLAAPASPPTATAPVAPTGTSVVSPPTESAAIVGTLSPSATPTQAATPTATYPPLYARIDSITINASSQYVVVYETFGYTEALPGMHIHFFFDTVPPDQAGAPGSGPWILYGGPRPFTSYKVNQRPAGARQMCALVANPDHSVIADSGNCVDLPLPP